MKKPGYIMVTLVFRKEGSRWTGFCEELGTATYGRSIPEAKARLQEAVFLHLNTLEDVGECERFFRDNGITFHEVKPKRDAKIEVNFSPGTYIFPEIFSVPKELCA